MINRLIFIALLLVSYQYCIATDGIAVSCQINHGNNRTYLRRFIIKDDDVVSIDTLYTAQVSGDNGCRWATLNVDATKVAFFRKNRSGKIWVSVMDIDGSNREDLVEVQGRGNGYMEWPIGDEIYYNAASGHNIGCLDDSRYFRKVNAVTGDDTELATLQCDLAEWGCDIYGQKATMVFGECPPCDNGGRGIAAYEFPGNGTLDYQTKIGWGCGNSMAPSGNYFSYWTDSWHSQPQIHTLNSDFSTSKEIQMAPADYNGWATNSPFDITCGSQSGITIGTGGEEPNWSCNSDQWVCYQFGWPPESRFLRCGSNTTLINWQQERAIMVSKDHRGKCIWDVDGQQCDSHSQQPRLSNEAGDFWCATPDEVNEDLRQYVDNQWFEQLSSNSIQTGFSRSGFYGPDISFDGKYLQLTFTQKT
ncbi:MAG: hypothetical protein GF350_09730, partial [Chitinivibrionales bacterium]|nr:hypothetical protein [Chitinivibrionales bacterium]